MAGFWVGTAGYSFPEWRSTFYPADLPEAHELSWYAQRFNSVELNSTFYRMPNARLLHGWVKETPATFTFALKAPRLITHELRLLDVGEVVSEFCNSLRPLGSRLGPLLFQVPPFQKRDLPRLEDFLHQLPPGYRYAVEFRHPSWFVDTVFDTLQRFSVALCVGEREEFVCPLEITASHAYLRLRRARYSSEELVDWRQRLAEKEAQGREFFVYFKQATPEETLAAATSFAALLTPRTGVPLRSEQA